MDGLFERLSRVLSALRSDDPPPARMLQHELRKVVNAVFDDQPAVAHLAVLADLLPAVLRGHSTENYKDNTIRLRILDLVIKYAGFQLRHFCPKNKDIYTYNLDRNSGKIGSIQFQK